MTLSQISSHYAGMLKAHAASPATAFNWEAMMAMATKIENLEKRLADLEKDYEQTASMARSAHHATARIG